MAEELRLFVRTLLYVAAVAVVYWLVASEPAGTVLLVVLGVALAGFVAVLVSFARGRAFDPAGAARGPLDTVNRVVGFADPASDEAPLEGHPDLVPTRSPWPIVTAAAAVLIGLGLIFGSWLAVPGLALLAFACVGWLTQLDRAR